MGTLVPRSIKPGSPGSNPQPRRIDEVALADSVPVDSVAVALAAAVADPRHRAQYLDEDNWGTGEWDNVGVAARSGRAHMVTVADDVLAFDLDTDDHVAAAKSLIAKLRKDDRPVLLVPSGRAGHCHLWTVVADPQAREHWNARARARGISPRKVMRPPGSPHRSGLPIKLEIDALEFLAAAQIERTQREHDDDRHRPDFWLKTLRTGRCWLRDDTSLSNLVWIIANRAIEAGWSYSRLRAALADPDNAGGASFRAKAAKRGTEAAEEWLSQFVWPKAVRTAGQPSGSDRAPFEDVQEQLAQVRAAVGRARWPGVAGATDRACLLVRIERAQSCGVRSVNMSDREVSEAAGVSRKTVGNSNRRLRAAGWLRLNQRGGWVADHDPQTGEIFDERSVGRRASVWSFAVPKQQVAEEDTHPPRPDPIYAVRRGGCTDMGSSRGTLLADIRRWRGIGLNAPRVVEQLLNAGPMTVKEIATSLVLGERNLRDRLMPKLRDLGLVTLDDAYRWKLVDDFDAALESAAVDLGLLGKAAAVKVQHDRERADYDEWRAAGSPNVVERRWLSIPEWVKARRELPKEADMSSDTAPLSPPAHETAPESPLSGSERRRAAQEPPPEWVDDEGTMPDEEWLSAWAA
jgi:DNA-binding transcriptional ArsR family regulator